MYLPEIRVFTRDMPKANRAKAVVTVPFRYAFASTTAAGIATFSLQPSSFPRVLEVADSFDEYRVSKFSYRVHPILAATATPTAAFASVAFYPGVTDNAPGSANDVSENVYSAVIADRATQPTPWVHVPPVVIHSYTPWLKTVAGSIDTALERFGAMFIADSAGSNRQILVEYHGEFQFKGPANTGATPAERQRSLLLAEKSRMLKILAITEEPKTKVSTSSKIPSV